MSDALSEYAHAFNLLGSCYRLPPQSPELAPALAIWRNPHWHHIWPGYTPQELEFLCMALNATEPGKLHAEWQYLFAGPAALPAPPWGSVYLDPEHVLRGDSTVALSRFLQQENLLIQTPNPEPPDHVGLILFQAAVLASQQRTQALCELLEQHLLTWLPLFLVQLQKTNPDGFYTALSQLALKTSQAALKAYQQSR